MMSTEIQSAPPTEKAIPLCADALVFPSAMDEPRNRLNPMEVVPTRLSTRLELPGGMVGSRPWKNLSNSRAISVGVNPASNRTET